MEIHFTRAQDDQLKQIATKKRTVAEQVVTNAVLRLLEEDARRNTKSRSLKLSPWEIGILAVGCFLMVYGEWPNFVTLPRLTIVLGFVCVAIVLWRFVHGKDKDNIWDLFDTHEDDSKQRYCDAQRALDKYFSDLKDGQVDLQNLASILEIQLKLEDFRIRFREAEHAKMQVWGTIFAASIVALIAALLNLFHKR